jgi:hypothetical protein
MNALQRNRRTRRTAKFSLESLDDRIVPSAMHATVGAGAGAVAAVSVVHRHGHHVAHHAVPHAVQQHQANATASAMPAPVTVSTFSLSHAHSSAKTGTGVAPSFIVPTPAPSPPTTPVTTIPTQAVTPPSSSPSPSRTIPTSPGPLPANVSQALQTIYQEYKAFQGTGGDIFTSSQANVVVLNGTNVGVQVHANGTGDFNAFIAQLKSEGMQVTASDATYGIVEGMLPIAQLPSVAVDPQTLSITPMYKPILS